MPTALGYAVMRWFHHPSCAVLVATPTLKRELEGAGLANLALRTRGVATELFRPDRPAALDLPRPVFL